MGNPLQAGSAGQPGNENSHLGPNGFSSARTIAASLLETSSDERFFLACRLVIPLLLVSYNSGVFEKQYSTSNRQASKMNLWSKFTLLLRPSKYTPLKTDLGDLSSQASDSAGRVKRLWLLILCTLTLTISFVSFHFRLWRDISEAPINLPSRQYVFVDHPELRPFDQEATEKWHSYAKEHWWSMPWTDNEGNQLVQGIDLLHKLHCLVAIRKEFTSLASNESRRDEFNAKTASAITMKMHLQHCFDFLRQVRKGQNHLNLK